MNSRLLHALSLALGLGSVAALASCGGGGGGSSGLGAAGMSIVSCSLGCSNSASNPGSQVSCGVTDVYLNQEIRVEFTSDVNLNSVTNNTFQVVEAGTGKTPPGTFATDPGEPRVLIYRPQLTFDSAGNPIFGLTADKTYFFKIPGRVLDPLGPYILNTIGQPNSSRLQCTLVASRGVFDANPGRPLVRITVDRVTGYDADGNPNSFEFNVPANGASDVYRNSDVRLVFDDVMNPGTLANPVTGTSNFIKVSVDPDGDTTDTTDLVPLLGAFSLTIDQSALQTTVVFRPSSGLPSSGSGPLPRKVLVELLSTISDLGGNLLLNPGITIFTPEHINFAPVDITETFDDTIQEDSVKTCSAWGGGQLGTGPGGGSGRLGELVVFPGQVLELNTDAEDFAAITNPAGFNPVNVIDAPVPLLVTGGVFEFSRLRVDAGSILRFRGSNPARVYVRGEAVIQGLIDMNGRSGVLHASDSLPGGAGGEAGAGGGAGGRGGNRPDGSAFQNEGGEPNTTAGPANVLDPATYTEVNGLAGGGIPFPSTIDPNPTFVAGGGGGLSWPQPTSTAPGLHMPAIPSDIAGLEFDRFYECRVPAPAAPGGGGGYALSGRPGIPLLSSFLFGSITECPPSAGGDSGALAIDDLVRSLAPELGLLRGGPGGGGGGAHLQNTRLNSSPLDCSDFGGNPPKISQYIAHSGAGGGAGGGAIQIAAGRRLILHGIVDSSGGDGGSGTFPPTTSNPPDLAQAGGGGAGGGVLLQSQQVQIQAIPARIKVSGGLGGEGTGDQGTLEPSRGGDGSPGFLRIETNTPLDVATEATKVVPTEADLQDQYGTSVQIEDIFSTAVWDPPAEGASGFSGAQSCWFRPSGNFFQLLFAQDGALPGWDMRLRIMGQAQPQSFRDMNDVFPGQTLESVFGSDFGAAPVVVRFQGARAVGTLIDPCAVPETGVASPLAVGSLTSWLRHPGELNDFFGDNEALTPNIFRFVILWDRSQPFFDMIEGLEDITVRIQPD